MRARATFVRRSLVFLRMKNKRTNGGRARTYVYVYIIRPKVVPELSTRRVGDHILPFPGRPTRVLRTVRATSVKTYADPNVPPSRLYGVIQLVRVFVIRCRLSKCRWRSTTTVWWRGGGDTGGRQCPFPAATITTCYGAGRSVTFAYVLSRPRRVFFSRTSRVSRDKTCPYRTIISDRSK